MPLNSATLAYALLLNERKKAAGRAALTRRLDNPEFAKRYRQKILGRQYRQKGRLLGAAYKAPTYMRRPGRDGIVRTSRVQRGTGMKKGDMADLFGMNMGVMRRDYPNNASLMEYAQLMKDKARAAYVKRKRLQKKSSAIRIPKTAQEKKEARALAYQKKKAAKEEAMEAMVAMVNELVNNSNPVAETENLGALYANGNSPPRPRVTRASTASAARAASAGAASAARAAATRITRPRIPTTNRVTRSRIPTTNRVTRSSKYR